MDGLDVHLNVAHMGESDCLRGMFLCLYAKSPAPFFAVRAWNTDVRSIPTELMARVSVITRGTHYNLEPVLLARVNGALFLLCLDNAGYVNLHICADLQTSLDETLCLVQTHLPAIDPGASEDSVYVKFWAMGANGGPIAFSRKILAPQWDAVHQNYTAKTKQQLDTLMQLGPPDKSGQLILWHGEPGTGKTWSLRALGQAWKPWCSLEYVTDPEVMFGDRAAYLTHVLLDNNGGLPSGTPNSEEKWRLLILEDTGELLRVDAKERTGQAMARLLNTVDGLLGQGLRVLVLITTNEELGRLHPAVTRPGRCLKEIEFSRFSEAEAQSWIQNRDFPKGVMVPQKPTIAELYGTLNGWKPSRDKAGTGFTG